MLRETGLPVLVPEPPDTDKAWPRRLVHRGKPKNVAVVAAALEPLAFAWATAQEVLNEKTTAK